MAPSPSYLDYLKDLLSPFGGVATRRMFGGAGVYIDDRFMAIVGDDDLWLKVDDETRATFEGAGLRPFEIEMNGKRGTMSYYNAPEEIFDDEDELRRWIGLALEAAERAARAKAPTKKKKRRAAKS